KPVMLAEAEVRRAAELLEVTANLAGEPLEESTGPGARARRVPQGVIAAVTPWNNPIAVPLGKIGPALLYGNAVVWKPSPLAAAVTDAIADLLSGAGCPDGLAPVVSGDEQVAIALAGHPRVDALTLTGSEQAGYALGEACLRTHKPFQAELGGNNAA